MAKGNLFLSQARGKVGSVVFYRKDGEQVTRVYTSQVSNPKTSAQNAQRAIFYTAQRWAAGAKYLIEQGQEGITNPTKARQAFLRRALNDIRANYLAGNGALNAKGVAYMQPQAISLTNGSLTPINYGFYNAAPAGASFVDYWPNIFTKNGSTYSPSQNETLQEFFNKTSGLGLNKQLTAVWLTAEGYTSNDIDPTIGGLNYKTQLHWSEVVFSDDQAALILPAFVEDEEEGNVVFNPAVLQPSWGGTDAFPAYDSFGQTHMSVNTRGCVAFALIVSDYTNNRWSRSNAPFAVNPNLNINLYDIIATYGNDAAAVEGEEYLDQAEVIDEGQQAGLAPRTVRVNLIDADPISMTRSIAKSVSLSVDSASRIGIQITPMNGDYSADSASVSVSGTADDFTVSSPFLLPTAYGKAWVVDLQPTTDPEAGQTTIISINVGGVTRTLTITWTASV